MYDKVIDEFYEKGYQVRLVVNIFRDVTYVQLRKYFLSYEGEWIPSKEGISIPVSVENLTALLDGLIEICTKGEWEEILTKYRLNNDRQSDTVP